MRESGPDRDDEGEPDAEGDRRGADRFPVTWSVDCETEDTFLYAAITNISALGIFVRTEAPLAAGTRLRLRFDPAPHRAAPLDIEGRVQWINPARPGCPNPGMGVRFVGLTLELRERIVEIIRTIAYLREDIDQAS